MLSTLALTLCAFGAAQTDKAPPLAKNCDPKDQSGLSLYNYTMQDVFENKTIPLSMFRGHVVLLVNVATY